jgi:Transposase IS116/IS110/IS902 family
VRLPGGSVTIRAANDPLDAEHAPGPCWPARPTPSPRTATASWVSCAVWSSPAAARQGPHPGHQPAPGPAGRLRRHHPHPAGAAAQAAPGPRLHPAPRRRPRPTRPALPRAPLVRLDAEIGELDREISLLVTRVAPRLLERHSVGVHTAAQLLITAGYNPDRLASEAAFAALCGTSPVKASSGKTTRLRLNRGGDRQANTALWTIANTRLIHESRTRAYGARRTAQGRPARRSSAASSATSPGSSTRSSSTPLPQPPPPLDIRASTP